MSQLTMETLARRLDRLGRENPVVKKIAVAALCTIMPLVMLSLAVSAFEGLRNDYEGTYQGESLTEAISGESVSVVCESDLVDRTGYDTQLRGKTVMSSSFGKEDKQSVWIISMRGNDATVSDGQGNIGRYVITKRDLSGVILVEAEKGVSVQVITIDPRNSSFVYTTQNVNVTWNRANTFVGRCRPGGP